MQSFRELTGNRHRNQWTTLLSVDSDAPFDDDGTGSGSLFSAGEQEIQEHADKGKHEDYENPQ
jgi:hypothetical protein